VISVPLEEVSAQRGTPTRANEPPVYSAEATEATPTPSEDATALMAARHAPAAPKISLELPPDSSLVLIETSHEKVHAPVHEATEAPRPRRVRPPARAEGAEGPLQLVETARKEPAPPGA